MRYLILGVCLVMVIQLTGQTIEGYIVNKIDNEPIVGATVSVQDSKLATISDLNGYYRLSGLHTGNKILRIKSVGFQDVSLEFTVSEGEMITKVIELHEKIYDLPQVVVESVTMTGGLSGVDKILGSAHYIGQQEIQKFSYTDINRTLRQIPGVNIQEEDGYGLRPNIGLRATGSERSSKITVMEDGVLIAPAPYAAPAAYYFPTIGRMEAVEIMKGSSQIKYGPFTTGGAINLISTPIPASFSGHADFIAGSDGYRMLHANLGNAHKNVAYLVETMQYSADGFKVLDNGGNTGFNKEDYLAKLRFHTNSGATVYQSLSAKVAQVKEISNETYLGLTESDFSLSPLRRYAASQKDVMNTEQRQISLSHFAALTSFLDVVTTAYRTDFSRNWYKLDKVRGTGISSILANPNNHDEELSILRGENQALESLAVKANNRSYYAKGIQTNVIFHRGTPGAQHKIDLSVRLHQDQIDRFQWVDLYDMEAGIMSLSKPGMPGTESNRIETANALSSYVQYKLEWNQWTFIPGLRYENISIERRDFGRQDVRREGTDLTERGNDVTAWIPGLAVSFAPGDATKVFGGLHKGFAPPGSKTGTMPEESWNYELGWRYQRGRVKAQVLGYLNDYSNLLGSDLAASGGAGSQDLFNGGEAIARGLEVEATLGLLSSTRHGWTIPLSFNYTLTDAQFRNTFSSDFEAWNDVESGDFLPYVSRHQFGVSLEAEHRLMLFDVSLKYQSAMLATAGSFADQSVERTDEAFTIDIAVNYRLSSALSSFANVNNVTNNLYVVSRRPAGLRPNLPRTFNIGLKANF